MNTSHSRQHLEGWIELAGLNLVEHTAQLVQRELHPQLGDLMDDDEEHLVVMLRDRFLRAEDTIELQVAPVGHPPSGAQWMPSLEISTAPDFVSSFKETPRSRFYMFSRLNPNFCMR